MKILIMNRQDTAVGYYRSWLPGRALRALGHEVTTFEHSTYWHALRPADPKKTPREQWTQEWLREHVGKFDLLITDRAVSHAEWGLMAGFCNYSDIPMITDFDDDFCNVPNWNPSFGKFQPGQEAREAGLAHLRCSEMATTSTPTLVGSYTPKTHALRLVPNRLDPIDWLWPSDPARKQDPHLRVLYGGANGHFGDLDVVRGGLQAVIEKQPVPWRLVCFGAIPSWLHQLRREMPGKVVRLPWIPFKDYARVVAWGGFDVAIAPLADHPFNLGKSNVKWQEAAIQGIPLLASKVGPYDTEIPPGAALTVENRGVDWVEGLTALLKDAYLREQIAKTAREAVLDSWVIDRSGPLLQNVVEEALECPRIDSLEATRLPGERQET
jgi:hypothetical protein